MPRNHSTSADALLRALACADPHCVCHRAVTQGQGLTHCPAHDDRHPSLSVKMGRTAVLWHCHAGCGQRDVAHAIRNLGL